MGRGEEDKWAQHHDEIVVLIVFTKACMRIYLLALGLNPHQCHHLMHASSEGCDEIVSEPSVDKNASTNRRCFSNRNLRNWCEGRIDNFRPCG